jgi:hypothetical protein
MRIRIILAAAAVPAALAASLFGATAASAASKPNPNPNLNSVIEVASQDELNALVAQGPIGKNIDVPAGKDLKLEWATVNGNVTVEGHLSMAADVVNGNVTVTGSGTGDIDGSGLTLYNGASHITGNLTVTGSGGYWAGNAYGNALFDNATQYGPDAATAGGTSQIDGGLAFQNNAGALYVGGPMHVAGKFTASGNDMTHWTPDGLTVSGKQVIS